MILYLFSKKLSQRAIARLLYEILLSYVPCKILAEFYRHILTHINPPYNHAQDSSIKANRTNSDRATCVGALPIAEKDRVTLM